MIIAASLMPAEASQSGGSREVTCGGGTSRCETLEVLSIGVTYDKYRQGKLWDALKVGTAFSPVREYDPAKVPWSSTDKAGQSGGRAYDALENATAATPMYWGMPSAYASIPLSADDMSDSGGPIIGLTGGAEMHGFSWHLFTAGPTVLSHKTDDLLELAFKFFDQHPDVPLLFISAVDTPYDYDAKAPRGAPRLLRDGRYFVERPDSAVVLVLGRRERVERLRKFAWDDDDNSFGQTKIRQAYYDLRRMLAKPKTYNTRAASVDEWLAETARLTKRDDIRSGWGTSSLRREWIPSPWFPVPWSKQQLASFDSLPTLGFIHRPVYIKWPNTSADPRKAQEERQQILKDGWIRAIRQLSPSGQPAYPARVVMATGGSIDRTLLLHSALNAQRSAGGPGYDINDKTSFIDMDRRLGDTGAATFFMQAAIGILGSYREGGVTAAVNLRDEDGASIVIVSPPSDELRAKQTHPAGGDVFQHKVEPSYDPGVYSE